MFILGEEHFCVPFLFAAGLRHCFSRVDVNGESHSSVSYLFTGISKRRPTNTPIGLGSTHGGRQRSQYRFLFVEMRKSYYRNRSDDNQQATLSLQ